jgi:hypothetical protein
MRTVSFPVVLLVTFLTGTIGALLARHSGRAAREQTEATTARLAHLEALVAADREAPVAPPLARAVPDTAAWQGELAALRSEVAQLRRLLAELPRPAAALGASAEGGVELQPLPPFVRAAVVDASGIEPAALAVIQQQLGAAPFDQAQVKLREGQAVYSVETRLADGRGIELAVSADGRVLARDVEISPDSLDPVMMETIITQLQGVPLRAVREVYEDGRTLYVVKAKDPSQAISLRLTPDGAVVQMEVERRSPPRPGREP